MESIAKLLKDTREDLDLSQMDVMNKTGISNKSLSRYENNMTEPDLKTLAELCSLYGISLDGALGLRSEQSKRILLSPEERKLLQQFRELPQELREMICGEINALLSWYEKEK